MWLRVLLLLIFAGCVLGEECRCDDDTESFHYTRRRLDAISDGFDAITSRFDFVEVQIETLKNQSVNMQESVYQLAEDVSESAYNTSVQIGVAFNEVQQSVIDEVDTAKENFGAVMESVVAAMITGIIWMIIGLIAITLAPFALRYMYRRCCGRGNSKNKVVPED